MPRLYFAIPGDLSAPTGGFGYDRRLIAALSGLGWEVTHVPLRGDYPEPDAAARDAARAALAGVPAGACVLIDGLAGGTLPEIVAAEAGRLRVAALVHHPLADETGLCPRAAERLAASERAVLAASRVVICTSARTAARLAGGYGVDPARITVAVPGTDPAPRRAPRDGAPARLLSVGSLIPRKRHDVLVEALAQLADLDWTARIVGSATLDPGSAAGLARQIEAAALCGRITLAGAVPDVRAEYDAAHLFVSASEYEGYGMACAEALRHGLPVVAARAEAIEDLVPERAGALVPPGDARAMAAALAALLRDADLRDRCADAAWTAGESLPGWEDTGRIVAAALIGLAR